MDPLSNWHRYVDQVSRPARRQMDDAADAPDWRPWKPTHDAPELEESVRAEAIPDLALALGAKGPVETLHVATTEYRDPTVHDVLGPIPSYSVPEMRAPSFEVWAPRLGRNGVTHAPLDEGGADPEADAVEIQALERVLQASSRRGAELSDDEPEDGDAGDEGDEPANGKAEALRYWDLLSQIRSHDVAQNSYKSTFRETREELVQRLLDPPLTLEEAARLLGVCPTTVRRYTNKGHLRHFRTTGNQRRFRLSDVLEFLESRASEIAADAQADRDAGHEG